MPAESAKRWTAAEARRLNEENPLPWPHYEVIDGELLVSPAPRFIHQRGVHRLQLIIGNYLESRPAMELLPGPADIELEPDSTLSPDLFVFRRIAGRRVPHWSELTSLLVVIEVLSPSTARNDRVKKRDYFMRNDVAEYWIVDLDARVVERWQHGEPRPEMLSDELIWRPEETSDPLAINLVEYFAYAWDEQP